MKRIIVYRYYHKFTQNRDLLKFIKYLNPSVQIFGLYGGPVENYKEASENLKEYFVHNYFIREADHLWKWKNGDMTYQMWYNDYGYKVDFDMMHAIEWDLLYFEPLDVLFAHVPPDALALTGLIRLWKIKRSWYWTNDEKKKKEWAQLMSFFREKYHYRSHPYAMIGPGTSLPRIFLEKIKNIQIPELELDELRIPLFAQEFGLKMINTHFYKKWFSRNEYKTFNCDNLLITMDTVRSELSKRNGRRVFHPFREDISFEQLVELHQGIPSRNPQSPGERVSDVLHDLKDKLRPRVQYVDFFYRKQKKTQ